MVRPIAYTRPGEGAYCQRRERVFRKSPPRRAASTRRSPRRNVAFRCSVRTLSSQATSTLTSCAPGSRSITPPALPRRGRSATLVAMRSRSVFSSRSVPSTGPRAGRSGRRNRGRRRADDEGGGIRGHAGGRSRGGGVDPPPRETGRDGRHQDEGGGKHGQARAALEGREVRRRLVRGREEDGGGRDRPGQLHRRDQRMGHVAGDGVAEVELGLQEGEGIVGVRHRPGCGLGARGRVPLHAMPRHAAGQDVLDVLRHRPAVRIAIGRVLGRRPRDDVVHDRGHLRHQEGGGRRILPDHAHEDGGDVLRRECRAADEEEIEDGPEREQVGATVDRPAQRLLRRHVERGPEEVPARRQVSLLLGQSRDAEVQDLGLARGQEHDVGGLDVAVNDPLPMRVVQPFRHALHDAERLAPRHGAGRGHDRGERLAVQVLEGHEQRARFRIATDVVHDHDVRVGQARGDLGLREEPSLELFPLVGGDGEGEPDGLEGDGPPEDRVQGLVHDAHHSAADLAANVVAADGGRRSKLLEQHRPNRPRPSADGRARARIAGPA